VSGGGAGRRGIRYHPGSAAPEIPAMHETPPVNPDSIRASIAAALACDELKVRGDGHHFEALVVCAAFEGKSRVARHQMVYAALGERMREEIHALSMLTMTPAEFAAARAQSQQ
jgi:acid stress-induced BolA-like protein IbaG/YrbA